MADASQRWSLTEIEAPYTPGGRSAWVAPARSADLGEVVLKVGLRHEEARDEAPGLAEWNGDGAVRLIASSEPDEHVCLLLLERCRPGESLKCRDADTQDRVIAGLLARLWRAPPFPHPFRALAEMCDAWVDGYEARWTAHPQPPDAGLVAAGLELFRSLPRERSRQVLLCTDLHADNVVSAEREPWLMIDPKPYVGDPTYDVLQHMLNCPDRLMSDPAGFAAQTAERFGLEPERLRRWLFARCVVGSSDQPELLSVAAALDVG